MGRFRCRRRAGRRRCGAGRLCAASPQRRRAPQRAGSAACRSLTAPPAPDGGAGATEGLLMQFGKVGEDKFHLDFRAPLTPFQAFTIALSQFNY